ncbi:MAG: protein kinase, partial [Candidatus Competibacterales bacterium]
AVHAQKLLHRDLKPDNVLVRRDKDGVWDCRIIDFGLALNQGSLAHRSRGQTILGHSIAGTIDYAAPEQLGRLPGVSVGPHSDLFGFGALCCYALTSTPNPGRLDWPQSDAPEDLMNLLDSCRAQDVKRRPASFAEVVKQLRAIAGGSDSRRARDVQRWPTSFA